MSKSRRMSRQSKKRAGTKGDGEWFSPDGPAALPAPVVPGPPASVEPHTSEALGSGVGSQEHSRDVGQRPDRGEELYTSSSRSSCIPRSLLSLCFMGRFLKLRHRNHDEEKKKKAPKKKKKSRGDWSESSSSLDISDYEQDFEGLDEFEVDAVIQDADRSNRRERVAVAHGPGSSRHRSITSNGDDDDDDEGQMDRLRSVTPGDLYAERPKTAEDGALLDGYYTRQEAIEYERTLMRTPAPPPMRWKLAELLGQGSFGKVYLGMNLDTGQLMAVKQVVYKTDLAANETDSHVESLEQEISLLRGLKNAHIVTYLGTERTEESLNIFLEYVPGGSITTLISKFGKFDEAVIRVYTRQLLEGLDYLHSHQIMHRDIKGANILVDNTGCVKLADFGASKHIADLMNATKQSLKGTPFWMAPEVIKQAGYGRQADIWSVGCTVIEMATGEPPWSQFSTQISALFHIATAKKPPPLPESLSPVAKDFLLHCFQRDPKNRPNARILGKHPFITGERVDVANLKLYKAVPKVPAPPSSSSRRKPQQSTSPTATSPPPPETGLSSGSGSVKMEPISKGVPPSLRQGSSGGGVVQVTPPVQPPASPRQHRVAAEYSSSGSGSGRFKDSLAWTPRGNNVVRSSSPSRDVRSPSAEPENIEDAEVSDGEDGGIASKFGGLMNKLPDIKFPKLNAQAILSPREESATNVQRFERNNEHQDGAGSRFFRMSFTSKKTDQGKDDYLDEWAENRMKANVKS